MSLLNEPIMHCLSFLQRKRGHKAAALISTELKFHMSISWADLIHLLEGLAWEGKWKCLFTHSWEGRRETQEISVLLGECPFGEHSSLETLPEPRKRVLFLGLSWGFRKVVCYPFPAPKCLSCLREQIWDIHHLGRGQAVTWEHSTCCGPSEDQGLSITAPVCVHTCRDKSVLPFSQLGTHLDLGRRCSKEPRWWQSIIPDPLKRGVQPLTPSSTRFKPAEIHSSYSSGLPGHRGSATTQFPPSTYRTNPGLPEKRQATATYLI